MTAEEVLEVLAKEIPFSRETDVEVSVILDGYTGFTPVQHTKLSGNCWQSVQKSFRDSDNGCQRTVSGDGKAA